MYKNILIIIMLFSTIAHAESSVPTESVREVKKANLEISNVWARKSLSPSNNSAAYMKINNPTQEQITIIDASAPAVANNVELHKSFVDDKGVSRMTSIDKIVVPAQTEIELKPGGTHIMLFDLKKDLSVGKKFPLEIKLQDSESIIAECVVK